MTKTHASDNELMNSAKSAVRTVQNAGQTPVGNREMLEKMMSSNSLFEFADAIHLGRTKTRSTLVSLVSGLTSQVEQLSKKGVK